MMSQRDRQILHIALPSIISNITVPLLGLIDVAITGHLGAAAYIGAIALGGMIFNLVYWIFGFLRMGTSGLTSQALGKRNLSEVTRLLVRSMGMAMGIALFLIILQIPIRELALFMMQPTAEVRSLTVTYFNICIWGAPAMLGLFGLNGWFIGMQNSRIPMMIAITQNIVNIIVSLALVFGLGMKVEGVASGTLIAQWCGFLMALSLLVIHYKRLRGYFHSKGLWARSAMVRFFQVNRDIFLRTLCLVSVLMFFTSAGSWQGEVILAVNTLLMQLYLLVSYVMDGFANAAEAMSGKYYGAGNRSAFIDTVRHCFAWGTVCTLLFTIVYIVGGKPFLGLLTDEPHVVAASSDYVFWAYLIPVCSIGAFIWDGVFIGITASREMLISSLTAAILFFITYYLCFPHWQNHGLWMAFIVFMVSRGVVQTFLFCKSLKIDLYISS